MRRISLIGVALVAVAAGFASGMFFQQERSLEPEAMPVIPVVEASEMELRTGDNFWGLHLDGVVALSSMLVKGGGHLVIISPLDQPDAKAYYHVRREKTIELAGTTFSLSVQGEDKAFVSRNLGEQLAAN